MATTPARQFRMADADWTDVMTRAAAEGITPSDVVREAVLAHLVKPIVPKGESTLAADLRRALEKFDAE